jgi:hypothetical protein
MINPGLNELEILNVVDFADLPDDGKLFTKGDWPMNKVSRLGKLFLVWEDGRIYAYVEMA